MPIKGRFCDITADHSHNKKADHTLTVPSLVCLVLDTTSSGYDLCKAFQGVDRFMNRRWKKRKERENKDKIASVQKLWIVKKIDIQIYTVYLIYLSVCICSIPCR